MFTKNRKGRAHGVKLYKEEVFKHLHVVRASQCGRITAGQIEAARRVISRQVKKVGNYQIYIRPSTSVSKKPSEVRMGKGKGAIDHYISRVKAGQLLFSIDGISDLSAYATFLKASRKLPIKIKIVTAQL